MCIGYADRPLCRRESFNWREIDLKEMENLNSLTLCGMLAKAREVISFDEEVDSTLLEPISYKMMLNGGMTDQQISMYAH